MFIDSHCHLNFPDFKEDLKDTLERAQAMGVKGFLSICTKLEEASQIQTIAESNTNVAWSVGVHPHETEGVFGTDLLSDVIRLSNHPKVVGIGETGLDFYYNHSPRDPQLWSFRKHIEAAIAQDLPLIIHTREADQDTIDVLDEYEDRTKGVFHCFSGTMDLCKKALDRGFYISISGIVTFKKADSLKEVAAYVPLDRLLIETDAPYLAPVPHRGKRNEPAFVVHTAEVVAELKNISLPALEQSTTENFFTLFPKTKSFFVME